MTLDVGQLGAKVQTWTQPNGRELLKRIVDANPGADFETIYRLFSDQCAPYFPEIVRYWLVNNYRALIKPVVSLDDDAVQVMKREIKRRATKMVMLDWTLSTGKKLRHCTGAECAREGGWLLRVSQKVPADATVGNFLCEDQVRAIWDEDK